MFYLYKEAYILIFFSLLLLLSINYFLEISLIIFICLFFLVFLYSVKTFSESKRSIPIDNSNMIISPIDGVIKIIEKNVERNHFIFDRVVISVRFFDYKAIFSPTSGLLKKEKYIEDLRTFQKNDEIFSVVIEMIKPNFLVALFVSSRCFLGSLNYRENMNIYENDPIAIGENIGILKFPGEIEILVPRKNKLLVWEGKRVIGGETVIKYYEEK